MLGLKLGIKLFAVSIVDLNQLIEFLIGPLKVEDAHNRGLLALELSDGTQLRTGQSVH
jgi:hypothetical protein